MGGEIEVSVRITKKFGTKIEKVLRDTVTFYEYEGIPIKNENYPDLIFEFEDSECYQQYRDKNSNLGVLPDVSQDSRLFIPIRLITGASKS